jgi:hypothetical protein
MRSRKSAIGKNDLPIDSANEESNDSSNIDAPVRENIGVLKLWQLNSRTNPTRSVLERLSNERAKPTDDATVPQSDAPDIAPS